MIALQTLSPTRRLTRSGLHSVTFSPDGTRYAYVARLGQEYVYMVDGKELVRLPMSTTKMRADQDVAFPRFTSNSKHAYFVSHYEASSRTGDSYDRLFFDGQPGPPAQFGGIGLVVSPDGDHFAYVAVHPVNQAQQVLIVDGKAAPSIGGDPQFSADSKHLFTKRGIPPNQATEVLLDGKPYLRGRQITLYIPPVGDLVVAVDERGANESACAAVPRRWGKKGRGE